MAVPFLPERDEFEGNMLAGKYNVTRKIGRGGMGAVYQATHVLMERVVAIKVVRANYANSDPVSLQRFRLEAKASSCLSHPNIMTVYDFGITDDGIAYLVMDYIDGVGLDVILRREGFLSPRRAISIFTQACNALAHAHDKGVVHRDLKPSNLMLVQDEYGNETVKIVDFGIAKMLPGRARSAEVLSDGGQVVGSPLYMSPEQCMDDDQDGRSDIYSLGCLLYEALTGFPPITDKHVLGIMYKHLNEPARPFATSAPERNIPTALETVVLKALAKNPENRHQSMREFEAELKRVMATLDAAAESEARYVDGADGIDPVEQHYLRKLRSATEQFGNESTEIVPFMHQLADYYVSRHKAAQAESQLRGAVELLVNRYGPWDIRVAEPVLRLAELYRNGGRLDDAEPLYRDLLDIKRTALGKSHPDIPFVMLRLAELYFATSRLDKAYKTYSQCLRIAESIFGPNDPVLSAIVIGLAAVLMQMEKFDYSAWLYHRALELNEYNLGPAHPAVIGPLVALGVVYRKLEQWDEAEQALRRAVHVHHENYDQETTEIAHALWLLAEIYSYRQMHDEAEELYDRVLQYFEANNSDADFVAQLYNTYGVHFVRNQKLERAETQFMKALKLRERKYGSTSEHVASSLNLIATLYHSQSKLELAEHYYQRSLDACQGVPATAELASENLRALDELYSSQQIIGSLRNLYNAANVTESENLHAVE